MKQLTNYEHKDNMLDSSYGRICYAEWCEKEVARITKAGGKALVRENPDNQSWIAVFIYGKLVKV